MRKVRKNNIGKKRKISKGGAMLYTAGIACLIALVGVVTIINAAASTTIAKAIL